MRKTTINISDDLDKNIEELLSLTDHGNFTRVIEAAVYNYLRMVQSSGNYWPTYTLDKVWVDAEAADELLRDEPQACRGPRGAGRASGEARRPHRRRRRGGRRRNEDPPADLLQDRDRADLLRVHPAQG